MKKLFVGSLFVGTLAAALFTGAVLGDDTVRFSAGYPGKQYFECTSATPTAMSQLDTHSVDAQGFCTGYPGHLTIPGSVLNSNYFVVNNAGFKDPRMTISGPVTCKQIGGPDSSRGQYAAGQSFCSMPTDLASN